MNQLIELITTNLNLYLLITIRITGIFVAAPIFARSNIPNMLKIGLSMFTGLILLPLMGPSGAPEIQGFFQLAIYSGIEFLIGILIGFLAFIYFSALYLAGTIIDTQMGFGMVNVFDPQTNTQIPVMGNFYNNLISLMFIIANGHHLLIRALVDSFKILPIGSSLFVGDSVVEKMIQIFMEFFILAVKFSAPVMVAILLANIVLGILARTMPQMNVFIVGLPLKIVVGMIVVIVCLEYLTPFSELMFDKLFTSIYEMLKILSEG